MEKINRWISILVILALSAAVLSGCGLVAQEEPEARTYGCAVYTEQGCAKFVVATGGEIEMQSGSTLDIQSGTTSAYGGDLTVTGALAVNTLSVTTDATIADDLVISPQTTLTVTQDATITPTGSYMAIQNQSGTAATSSIAAGTAGQLLYLTNVSANSITISDTGTLKLSGNIAIGQYDSLVLVSDGTNWIEVSTSDN